MTTYTVKELHDTARQCLKEWKASQNGNPLAKRAKLAPVPWFIRIDGSNTCLCAQILTEDGFMRCWNCAI